MKTLTKNMENIPKRALLKTNTKRFISEEEVVNSWIYQIFLKFYQYIVLWFHRVEVEGIENLDTNEAYLFVTHHSFHNQDIFLGLIMVYLKTGKPMRGLLHRIIYLWSPWIKYLGLVPGHRNTAVDLLKSGHWVSVIPGGGEEAIEGHEKAYDLHWSSSSGRKRLGWAHVSKEANVKVVPVAGIHTQEMCFNIFAYLCNLLYISHMYDYLIKLPGILGWFFFQLKLYFWFTVCTYTSIPIPVKTGAAYGTPMSMKDGETIENFAERVEKALQDLIMEKNPGGLNYSRAIRARFETKED